MKIISGKQYEWRTYYDIEDSKLLSLGKSQVSQIAENFCRTLEKNRYFCGIYASADPLNNLFNEEDVRKDFAVWVAHYDIDKPGYSGDWGIWQYTSKGRVDGIWKCWYGWSWYWLWTYY